MARILIIRFRRVGDAVVSSALCTTLKESIPDAEIHYVLNDNIAPLFENHPDIDKLITFTDEEKHSLPTYLSKIKKVMKEGRYDIIIDTRSTTNTMYFPLFSLRSKYRIGRKKAYLKLAYTNLISNFYRGDQDVVQLLLKLLNPLEKEYKINYNPNFKLYCTDAEKQSYKEYMVNCGIDFKKPVIVCAITSRLETKRWNHNNMKVTLLKMVSRFPHAQFIFNYGGKEEKDTAEQLFKEMNSDSRIFINVEAKNLRELGAMMCNTTFFFGNEGGPRHIAQAFNVPSFAIYSPSSAKKEWLPNASDRYQGIEAKDIDILIAEDKNTSYQDKYDLISVDEVWKRLEPMMSLFIKE